MAYSIEKGTNDIVVNGFEQGIMPSPHKGIANIQNANISTETGEVINSFLRVQDIFTGSTSTGTLAYADSSHLSLSIANTNNLFKGNWIQVLTSSNTTELPLGIYYVPPSTGSNFQLANYYNTVGTPVMPSVLVVGGGGGGGTGTGSYVAGGGGGGGAVVSATPSVYNGLSYAITVGAGGAADTAGSSSSFVSTTAAGGGYGGYATSKNGGAGANGGGGASGSGSTAGTGGTGTYAGGSGQTGSNSNGAGGGGGGAGGAGTNAPIIGTGGAGGAGIASSISGTSTTYGSGGGGAGGASGASGGSGAGAGGTGTSSGGAGTANLGGGGGGGAGTGTGGTGGSGVVIISAPIGMIASATGGTHTTSGGNDIWTFTSSGTWVPTITAPSPYLTGFTAGLTGTFVTARNFGTPLASCTETYYNSGTPYNRYYILDNQNLVWVYDTINETLYSSTDNVNWLLPDYQTGYCTSASGIGVISGMLIVTASNGAFAKPTVLLGNTNSQSTTWTAIPDIDGWQGVGTSTAIRHYAFTGHSGKMYITDGSYIAGIVPDSVITNSSSTNDNVQSLSVWTISSQYIASYTQIAGTTLQPSDGKRVPVVFFTNTGGVLPTAISANTVYYVYANVNAFQVYANATGGSALDIQTGTFGTQYVATFYPLNSATDSTSETPTYVYTNQLVNLPIFEIAQCMAEIGTTVVIGCQSNLLYPWNQIDTTQENNIALPESNTVNIITVHQMGYIFTGNKGNVYLTDGNVASAVTTVPDYCAGVPGTPTSYMEPVFEWGGAMYLRGRVYFSIMDQTSAKLTGNCGGIWSFIPTQNLYIGQDVGIGLRLENQNSYGTYNGMANLLIPKVNQYAIAPQYFSAWQNYAYTPVTGIDATGTTFSPTTIIETDAIPTGTMLDKKTFAQIEFKLSSPLGTGDSVTLFYRKNLTGAWVSCGAVQLQNDRLSGYVNANFEKSQWLQLRAILNASASFIRMAEMRIR